jgi:hypothetical protein
VEEDFYADLALLGDDPYKPIDIDALEARSNINTTTSEPEAADGADPAPAQPAPESSPGPS